MTLAKALLLLLYGAALALLSELLGGCSTIAHERVDGWPALQIVEHRVSHAEMRNRCAPYVGALQSPEACAEFDFKNARCDIWLSADFRPASYVITHERQHCLGFDHIGSTAMRDLLAAYRRK